VLATDCRDFTGTATTSGIVLRWQLLPDGQPHQYFLQRSIDGILFTNISKIEPGSYSFTDRTFSNGANFYRIMQTMPNAAAQQLCRIVEVTGKRSQSVVNLLGNPVGNHLLLSISSLLNQQMYVEVVGADGRKAGSWMQNAPMGNTTLKLPVSKLSPGIYLLKVTGQDVQFVTRFVKE
jgi:hypothetical protein